MLEELSSWGQREVEAWDERTQKCDKDTIALQQESLHIPMVEHTLGWAGM